MCTDTQTRNVTKTWYVDWLGVRVNSILAAGINKYFCTTFLQLPQNFDTELFLVLNFVHFFT